MKYKGHKKIKPLIRGWCVVMTCAETYGDLGDALRPALVVGLGHPRFRHLLLDSLHLQYMLCHF